MTDIEVKPSLHLLLQLLRNAV